MITIQQLNSFLTSFLYYDKKISAEKIDPENGNGLQVKGAEGIKKVGFGVTASEELFIQASKAGCEALVVHHGIRWPDTPHYNLAFQKRMSYLIKKDISLFAYHYLLDSHPKVGNNAQILKLIGVKSLKPYEIYGADWGWYGRLDKEKNLSSLVRKCEAVFRQKVKVYNFGKSKVKTIAAISGGGSPKGSNLQNVLARDIDLYITGEAKEGTREFFREIGVNFLAGGHYATETLGVQALMKEVKKKFKNRVKVEYLELWNEV